MTWSRIISHARLLRIPSCCSCLRLISTCPAQYAGFQVARSGLPMEVRLRMIERKKKKIEKIKKQPLQIIPITDYYIPYSWKTEARQRPRQSHSDEKLEERILLEKGWATYTNTKRKEEVWKLKQLIMQQAKAMEELKQESTQLYEAALCCTNNVLPFRCRGPVHSMPCESYLAPLGGYINKDPPFSTDSDVIQDKD